MVSVLPINTSLFVVPLEEDPLEELPEEEPEPDPPLTELPPGRVRVAPLVENTILPLLSVRYTVMPALASLPSASEVGWP